MQQTLKYLKTLQTLVWPPCNK